jgi:AcrR family transcriptional regulator
MNRLQPRARRKELRGDVRERKLVAALIELLNDGTSFADILIEDVATRAGITRAGFYYFFQSKQELLIAALSDFVGQIGEACDIFLNGGGEDIREELRSSLAELGRTRRPLQALTRALSDAAAMDQATRDVMAKMWERYVPRIAGRLRQYRAAQGRKISEAAAKEIARALVWMNERNFYRLSAGSSTAADWDALVEALAAIWIGTFVGGE